MIIIFFFLFFAECPTHDCKWIKNDSKVWPRLTYEDMVDYLILSRAYDSKAMKAFRAMYGYNYVQNGWMGDIYFSGSGELNYLKATVSPSQPGIGRSDYNVWVAITMDCTVLTAHCTCPAGNGRSCSHISALLYAISLAWSSGVGGTTCTDQRQAWGKGASKSLTHEKISDISFKRPRLQMVQENTVVTQSIDNVEREGQFLDHSDLQKYIEESPLKELWNCKDTMLYQVLKASGPSSVELEEIQHGDHNVEDPSGPVTLPLACCCCAHFYKHYILLQRDHYSNIQKLTINQNNNLWIDSRKIRLTASRISAIPKSSRADPEKFINGQLYPRFKGCAATRHGLKNEATARQWFQHVTGETVSKSGIVICKEEPYLAASPDGFVNENTILEIKCPYRPLKDLIESGKYDVMLNEGKPFLDPKGKNGYFCQVQMTMFCTKTKNCKFVLWSAECLFIINVPFCEQYVTSLLPRIRRFYFEKLLARITDDFHYKRLKLSKEYVNHCR